MARTPLTEEEKKARAEARKAQKTAEEAVTRETPANDVKEAEKDDLRAQNELLQKQIKQLMEQMANLQKPQVIQVTTDTERVHLLWQAEVADDNVQFFGDGGRFGRVVGKAGEFYMTKTDFTTIMDDRMRYFLNKRWLIVLDGLNEDEKEAYNVNYKDGEYLDKAAFRKIIEMGDKILDLYPNLCDGNREMVAQRYFEAFQNNSALVKRETVVKLNDMSKDKEHPRGRFMPIIEAMNRADEGITDES